MKGWKAWVKRKPLAGQPAFLVDLSPTLNFMSLLPVLPPPASPCFPLPGTFVFTWPTSQGTRSYLWLFGLAADYAAPVRLFHSSFSPAPNLNCSVISCHPPSTTSHIPYHIPNNVRFHCRIQRQWKIAAGFFFATNTKNQGRNWILDKKSYNSKFQLYLALESWTYLFELTKKKQTFKSF